MYFFVEFSIRLRPLFDDFRNFQPTKRDIGKILDRLKSVELKNKKFAGNGWREGSRKDGQKLELMLEYRGAQ